MTDTEWIIFIGVSYLSGSVPYALLIGWVRGVDLRKHGSGNVGATNCGRICGRKFGILCFCFDLLKGCLPALVAGWYGGCLANDDITAQDAGWWMAVAAASVFGHVFPVWLKFKGGKGVATGVGAILGVWPFLTLPGLFGVGTWLLLAAVTKYSSVSSVSSAALVPFYFWILKEFRGWDTAQVWPFLAVVVVMVLLITVRHWGNFQRLRDGTEAKLGASSR